jgi:hypothetical protein
MLAACGEGGGMRQDQPAPAANGQNTVRFELEAIPPEVDPAHTLAFTSVQGVLCTGMLTEVDIVFDGGECPDLHADPKSCIRAHDGHRVDAHGAPFIAA